MNFTVTPFEPDNPTQDLLVTRRRLVEIAGVTLVGTALLASAALKNFIDNLRR